MTLRALRDRLSVLHVALACVAVLGGSGVRWWSLVATGVLVGLAFWRRLPPEPSPRSARLWTALVFIALVASSVRAVTRLEFLDAGVDFLLLLIVQRFFQRQRAREHMQLLLLSSLLMVIAAVINTGLNYPLLLALYLVVTTMTLIVNHLLSEGERLGPRIEVEVAKAGMRNQGDLWRAAVGVATFAAAGGLVVFLLFPRFGAGVFLRGEMNRGLQTGFSGEVELGDFGRIKSDPSVVARLIPLQGGLRGDKLDLHLRGSSLDQYHRGHWTQSRDGEATPLKRWGDWRILAPAGVPQATLPRGSRLATPRAIPLPGFAASEHTGALQITLEDVGAEVLFVPSTPLAVKLRPRGSIERRNDALGGLNGEVRVDKLPGPMQYDALYRSGRPTDRELDAVGSPPVDDALAAYLQRSPDLSTEVTALAQRITDGAGNRRERVEAIMRHLGQFTYSLELARSERVQAGADPIEGFLFDTRRGHCEYFATAMAVLLREVGVPTRLVNGYYGAHHNPLGDFYAVRQADAHSWVEVHFGPLGWVTFDPTPPAGREAGDAAPWWPAAHRVVDAMRNAYLQYVIDYDLGKQIAMLRSLGVGRTSRASSGDGPIAWRSLTLWVVLGGGLVGAGWLWRARRGAAAPELRLYLRVLDRLAARGHVCAPHESATRFAQRLAEQGVAGAESLLAFAEAYEALRFGPQRTAASLQRLRVLADRALRAAS